MSYHTHLLGWLTTANAGEDAGRQSSHSLLEGTQDSTATLENSWPGSYIIKHGLTLLSSNHTPGYLPK